MNTREGGEGDSDATSSRTVPLQSPLLPAGLELNSATGHLFGTPTEPCFRKLRIVAENSSGRITVVAKVRVAFFEPQVKYHARYNLQVRRHCPHFVWFAC